MFARPSLSFRGLSGFSFQSAAYPLEKLDTVERSNLASASSITSRRFMHSLLLSLFRRFLSSVRRTILYPPRWTSRPGVHQAEVIRLSEVHRPSAGRQPTSSKTAAGAHELKKPK
jgi:hypothetical protein